MNFDSDCLATFTMNFAKFFSMFNVLGTLPIFMGLTASMPPAMVRRTAFIIAATALLGTYVFIFAGTGILSFFDISLEAFRIAGGIVVGIAGYSMLSGQLGDDFDKDAQEEEKSHKELLMYAVTPLGIPLILGPGAISLVISAAGDTLNAAGEVMWDHRIALMLALLAVTATMFILFSMGRLVKKILGVQGTRIILKIMGLILMVMAVQMAIRGTTDVIAELFQIKTIAPQSIDLNA